jgi:hypothetical protein
MQHDAMLTQLGYIPNDALLEQLDRIITNTEGFDKIGKHILDLHDHLKVDNGHVAMSNSEEFFKIKVESDNDVIAAEAMEKIDHFAEKYKVALRRVDGKKTFYILGFKK